MRNKLFNIVVLSALSAMLCGCVNISINENGEAVSELNIEDNAPATEASENILSMANPWEEAAKEDVLERLNIDYKLPERAENVSYMISESLKMAEADFVLDGLEFSYRIGYTKVLQDISGLNYEWTVDESHIVNDCDGRAMRYLGEEETVDACLWYDDVFSRTNCLSVAAPDLDGFDILAIASEVYNQLSEDECIVQYSSSPYWEASYDIRYLRAMTLDNDETVFSFYSPLYDTAGSNVVSVSIRENTTCDDVLLEMKKKHEDTDAENILTYFGADGLEAYTYTPSTIEGSGESELEVFSSYTAIQSGDMVILLDAFYTAEADEKMSEIISLAFETVFDTFILVGEEDDLVIKSASTPTDALELLMEGNSNFLSKEMESMFSEKEEGVRENGQHPYAIVITCADSTVPVEQIFDCKFGEIIVLRTAGAVIGDSELDSIERYTDRYNVPLIVGLGHTNCDAIEMLHSEDGKLDSNSLDEETLLKMAETNVINTIDKIHTSDIISEMEENQEVKVIGAIYDIQTGEIEWK